VFVPLAGAVVIAVLLKGPRLIRGFALAVAVADLVLAAAAFYTYSKDKEGLVLVERLDWIPSLNIQYLLGLDGLNAPMVLLTGILGVCAVFASWHIQERVREYFVWLLVLQTAVMGVFLSLDFVLFFIFWELELLPMYFLIAVWGTGRRREYSAMKFVVFTILGSAFMLVAFLVVYFSTGSLDMIELVTMDLTDLLIPVQVVFMFFFLAFAVKLPVWPLHSWLPDAHTDAPTAASVMLAGVLIKMGGYGMIRVLVTMFPDVTRDYAWFLVTLAVVSIIYGAIVTIRQSDLKRLIAFSSISHMGLVLLGIGSVAAVTVSPVGLNGAAMQMFTHGTITGLLFLVVGLVYEKTHTRYIPDLGGLASRMPFVATAMIVAGLASLGLPALSGFVSEALVFLGTFFVWGWPTAIAVFSIVLTAGYILWMIQRVLFGPTESKHAEVGDASLIEAVPIVILLASIVVVGVYPALVTDVFKAGLEPIVERFG
jgi:NADH-quinone oxidoreductase subunit M